MAQGNLNNSSEILTTGQIAKYCQVDARTVNRWIREGLLKSHALPITGFKRVKTSDFLHFLNEQKLPVPDSFSLGTETSKVRRILIVDDDVLSARAIQRLLNFDNESVTCEVANSGFEAGLLLEKNKPDLMIVDLRMPQIDGFAVCRSAKSNPGTASVKILAISGHLGDEGLKDVLAAGADAFLEKPFEEEALRACIRNLLNGKGPKK